MRRTVKGARGSETEENHKKLKVHSKYKATKQFCDQIITQDVLYETEEEEI